MRARAPKADPSAMVGYVRVSTAEQADHGVSLGAQRQRLADYARAMDLTLVHVFEDAGVSAKSVSARPGLRAALAALDKGEASGIVVTKLDRLTRSVRDLGDLVDRYFASRFSLLSLGDSIDTRSAAGRLVLNVLGSVAQWEREAISERVRDAMGHLRRRGFAVGHAPLGHVRGEVEEGRVRLAPVGDELETVGRIAALRAAGATLREIAATMEQEGRRTKRGGKWAPETINKVLRRMQP